MRNHAKSAEETASPSYGRSRFTLDRVLLGIAVGALLIGALLLFTYPGTGSYVADIYAAYPIAAWVAFATALIASYLAAAHLLVARPNEYGWAYGIAPIVVANTLILLVPTLRGYEFSSQWDSVQHYAYVASILQSGHIDSVNFYPFIHLLVTAISTLTSMEPELVMLLFLPGTYLLFVSNMTLLAWAVSPLPWVRGLVVGLGTPLVFGAFATEFRPTHVAVSMIPLVLALFTRVHLRAASTGWAATFVTVLIALPFLHPWAVVTTFVVLCAFVGSSLSRLSPGASQRLLTPLLLLLVAWLSWFMSFRVFGVTLNRLVESFLLAIGPARSLDHYIGAAERGGLSLVRVLGLIIFTYGPALTLGLLVGAAMALVLIRTVLRARRQMLSEFAIPLSFTLVILGSLAVLSLFVDIVTESPLRVWNQGAALVPVVIATAITSASVGGRRRIRSAVFAAFAVTAIAAVLGILSSHMSPLNGQPSRFLSSSQRTGHETFVRQASAGNGALYTPFRGAKTLYAVLSFSEVESFRSEGTAWEPRTAPAHFGYKPDPEGFAFEDPGYLWLTAHEVAYYRDVWPEGGRFTPGDFGALESDVRWHRVYSSAGLTIWRWSGLVARAQVGH